MNTLQADSGSVLYVILMVVVLLPPIILCGSYLLIRHIRSRVKEQKAFFEVTTTTSEVNPSTENEFWLISKRCPNCDVLLDISKIAWANSEHAFCHDCGSEIIPK